MPDGDLEVMDRESRRLCYLGVHRELERAPCPLARVARELVAEYCAPPFAHM